MYFFLYFQKQSKQKKHRVYDLSVDRFNIAFIKIMFSVTKAGISKTTILVVFGA